LSNFSAPDVTEIAGIPSNSNLRASISPSVSIRLLVSLCLFRLNIVALEPRSLVYFMLSSSSGSKFRFLCLVHFVLPSSIGISKVFAFHAIPRDLANSGVMPCCCRYCSAVMLNPPMLS